MSCQVLQLEKANKSAHKELSDIKSELESQQVKIRQQTKELKDAVTARKLAMDEFTELNEKVIWSGVLLGFYSKFHYM